MSPTPPANVKMVDPQDVVLLPGSRPGYWHIMVKEAEPEKRVGSVQVSPSFHHDLGEHVSVDIRLNQPAQSRGIGRVALQAAVELSGHDVVYAHMSKANVASYKAAKHAGFVDVVLPHERQRVLRWRRVPAVVPSS